MSRPTISSLKKKADKVFSLYIRQRGAVDGYNNCITCGVRKPWKELQCGHFISRRINYLRFSPDNAWPQCMGCNVYRHGEQYIYSLRLDQMLGDGTAARLHQEANTYHKFTIQELSELIEDYTQKLNNYNS